MRNRNSRRRGTVLVYLAIVMVALFAIAAMAVDFGRAEIAKTQLRALADAAALYGSTGASQGYSTAWAQYMANQNTVDGNSITLQSGDVQTGNWSSGTFTNAGTPTNAVKVSAYYTVARGGGVLPYFGSIVGMGKMNITAVAIATAGSTAPYEIIGLTGVTMSGGTTDSYNSTVSTTGYTTPSYQGNVESNGSISMSGSATIGGTALAGIGQSVSMSGSASAHATGNVTAALTFPNASAGSAATTNDDSNIPAANYSGGSLNVSGGKSITLPGGTYYVKDWTLSGGSTVQFTGAAVVYATGKVDLSGGSVTTYGSVAENLEIKVIGSGDVTVSGSSAMYGDFYCPQSKFTLSGSGMLAGRIIAGSINQSGSATIHADTSLVATSGNSQLVQ